MRIVLYAKSCEFAGAALLAAALKKFSSNAVSLIYHLREPYNFRQWFPDALQITRDPRRCIGRIARADWILLMGAPAVHSLMTRLSKHAAWKGQHLPPVEQLSKEKQIACFATGSQWHMEGVETRLRLRSVYRELGSLFFAMPNLMHLTDLSPLIPYYQPIAPVYVEKADQILLSHSPGAKLAEDSKGTAKIARVFQQLCEAHSGAQYEILSGLTNAECIRARARAHIFVDQIPALVPGYVSKGVGGLGKSGLEAMASGCVTITSAEQLYSASSFPSPPVLIARTEGELYRVIEDLIVHPSRRAAVQLEQTAWAREFVSPEFVAEHVLHGLQEFTKA